MSIDYRKEIEHVLDILGVKDGYETEIKRLQALADLVERVGEDSIRKVDKGEWVFTSLDEIDHSRQMVRREGQKRVDALNELKPKYDRLQALSDLVPEMVEALEVALAYWSPHDESGYGVLDTNVYDSVEQTLAEARRVMEDEK